MDSTVSKALQVCSPPYNMELARASTEQVHLPSLCNSTTSSAMDVLCNMVSSCEQDGFLEQSMQHGAMHHMDKASSLLDILYYGGVGGSEPNKQLAELMDVEDNDHHHAHGHHIGLLHPALFHQGYRELRHFKLPLLEQEPEASENKEESKTGVAAAPLQQHQQQPTCSTASVETKASTEVRPSARRNLEMAIKKQAAPSVSCSAGNQSGAGRAAIATAAKRAHLCSYEEEDDDDDEEEDDDDVDDDERRKGCQQASKKMRLHATSASEVPGPLPDAKKVNGGGQRMTHIAVERNRRKQMNEHLAILRSLMPNSYVQRGDQASIIGGVVEFIKELQQLLSSLEAQKRRRAYAAEAGLSPRVALSGSPGVSPRSCRVATAANPATCISPRGGPAPASAIEDLAATSRSELADVEVKLSGAANVSLRTLSHVAVRGQLLLLVAALQSLSLEILHLNITTLQRTVLYTFTLKIGIECRFSVDDLATAVQEIFRNIHTTNTVIPQ